MPPALPHQAQYLLQERINIIPQNGEPPNYWLFLIFLGSVGAFAVLSAAVGFLAAKYSRSSRSQRLIEKKAALSIQRAEERDSSTSTLADDDDDLV